VVHFEDNSIVYKKKIKIIVFVENRGVVCMGCVSEGAGGCIAIPVVSALKKDKHCQFRSLLRVVVPYVIG
jgi:hypothetical protein